VGFKDLKMDDIKIMKRKNGKRKEMAWRVERMESTQLGYT